MKTARCVLVLAAAAAVSAWVYRQPPRPVVSPDLAGGPPVATDIEVIGMRTAAKEMIARDAAAGRRSLLEAAALFRELNRVEPAARLHPAAGIGLPIHAPGQPDEEQLCLQVIDYVRLRIDPPDRAAAAVDRLVAEFEAELCERGAIRLPDAESLEPVAGLLDRAQAELAGREE